MRESRLYLKFFQRNWWIIAGCVVVMLGLSKWYMASLPMDYSETGLYEVDLGRVSASDGIALADKAVAMMRSQQLVGALGGEGQYKVTAFKNSPLSINLTVASLSQDGVKVGYTQLNNYLISNYPVRQVGVTVPGEGGSNLLIWLFAGMSAGLVSGIIFSLIREYWRKF